MNDRETAASFVARRGIDLKKLAIFAGALVVVFLLGFIPARISARNAQQLNTRLEHDLQLASACNVLGMVSYEANRNNYATAGQRSSEFFNGLRAIINKTGDEALKQSLRTLLGRRDQITLHLAQANPAVKETLARSYAELFQIVAAQRSRH